MKKIIGMPEVEKNMADYPNLFVVDLSCTKSFDI